MRSELRYYVPILAAGVLCLVIGGFLLFYKGPSKITGSPPMMVCEYF